MTTEHIMEMLGKAGSTVCPLRWQNGILKLVDQRLLPEKNIWLSFTDAPETSRAIKEMVVRGAPAIGITAAFGMAMAARIHAENNAPDIFIKNLKDDAETIGNARPTAVNLKWAVDKLLTLAINSINKGATPGDTAQAIEDAAIQIWAEDVQACISMGRHGGKLLPDSGGVLTHCNAGALATGGYGTALGVIRGGMAAGKQIQVFADETRPWLQGARLTAWELLEDNIPVTLLVEGAAGYMMRLGRIGAVVTGADRIAANGDVANKIGTYMLAELARANNIPFYVAAPLSTIDPETPDGDHIPVEERNEDEVLYCSGRKVAAKGAKAANFVFDITPSNLVTAIITEKGVLSPPYAESIELCLSEQ
jgi:methylthioribose-1-phosphate isomerase